MKTIVYQSYRRHAVPGWITRCMASVRAWAAAQGFEYRLYDDAFFGFTPDWFREKAGHAICPVTDLARLVAAKALLREGFERTVWVDADLLVFDPGRLAITLERDFMLCRELWSFDDAAGQPRLLQRVNNAVAVFCQGSLHLDFLIDAALRIAHHRPALGKLDIGTDFLSGLRALLPFPLLENVGLLNPALMAEIGQAEAPRLRLYAQALNAPLAAANLCGSLVGDEALADATVQALLDTRGQAVNRWRG